MSGESKESNLGWVSIEDLHNTFIHARREMDIDILGSRVGRNVVLDALRYLDSMEQKLYRLARTNYESYLVTAKMATRVAASQKADEKRLEASNLDEHKKRLDEIRRRSP